MPYPNFHAARVEDPDKFERIVVLQTLPNGIMIYGGPLKSDPQGSGKPQAYRFPKNKFTVEQAKAWLKEHDIKTILFEPATGQSNMEMEEDKELFKELFNIDDKPVFKVGIWNGKQYTIEDLKNMVHAFNKLKDKLYFPLKLGHANNQKILQNDGLPAAGWISNLKVEGNKLLASFKDIPKKIKEFIDRKAYLQVSSEIWHNFRDKETDSIYPKVLSAVALLGADLPAVSGLGDWGNFYSKDNEEIDDVQVCFFTEQDFENKSKSKKEDYSMADLEKIEQLQKENEALKTSKMSIEKEKEMLETKNAELTKDKDELSEKYSAQVKKEKEEKMEMRINEFIEKGNILPSDKAQIKAIYQALDNVGNISYFAEENKEVKEEAVKILETFISNLKKLEYSEQSEKGKEKEKEPEVKKDEDPNSVKLDAFAQEIMKRDNIEYGDAYIQAGKEHPELIG